MNEQQTLEWKASKAIDKLYDALDNFEDKAGLTKSGQKKFDKIYNLFEDLIS